MEAVFTQRPAPLQPVGNGSWLYCHDITPTPEGEWSARCVTVWEPLTANKILQAVIADEFPDGREQKLINDYNAATLAVSHGDSGSPADNGSPADIEVATAREAYTAFLRRRAALKAQVHADFAYLTGN